MRRTGWRVALRIARRDAARAKGRSALIVAMIGLPILAIGAADVLYRSFELDTHEELTREMGRSDAAIHASYGNVPVHQSPDGDAAPRDDTYDPRTTQSGAKPFDVGAVVPPGSRVISDETHWEVRVSAADGIFLVSVREFDYADPMADGMVHQIAGRAPEDRDEVALTEEFAELAGLSVGDRIQITDAERTFTVVGITRVPGGLDLRRVHALPGALPDTLAADERFEDPSGKRWLVDTPGPVTWEQVLAANDKGAVVNSRAVVLDPPPDEQVPYFSEGGGQSAAQVAETLAISVLVVGMVALEIVLLAGAAFAVGARRQRRALALLVAGGGDARHARRVVLGGGVVLGLVAGILAVVLAVAVVWLTFPLTTRLFETLPGHLDVRPAELGAIMAVATVTGLLAAVVPARSAARQDVMAALAGRPDVVRTKKRQPIFGLLLAGAGAVTAAFGVSTNEALVLVTGAALTQVGFILMVPFIVERVARLGARLPVAPRLALRDAARHRGRTAPAVGAIMAGVAGTVAVSLYVVSQSDHDRRMYTPRAFAGQVELMSWEEGELDDELVQRAESVARAELPVTDGAFFHRVAELGPGCETRDCVQVSLRRPPEKACPLDFEDATNAGELARRYGDDPRCQRARHYLGTLVGDVEALRVLAQRAVPEAERILSAGGVVVFDPTYITDGKATVELWTDRPDDPKGEDTERIELPAAHVELAVLSEGFLMLPSTADRLGLGTAGGRLLFNTSREPSDDEEATARAALERTGWRGAIYVERGYVDNYGIGLWVLLLAGAVITLGASGIATGLATTDGRADQATLAAVGASPRARKVLAGFQAGTVAGLGTALGIVAGFVPGVAVVSATEHLRVLIPWQNLLLIVLVVPALATVAALILTRARVPLERRIA